MENYELSIEENLKRDAFKRMTNYTHPQIKLQHQPINARQCNQLQQRLRQLVRQKVDVVREQYQARQYGKEYQKVYQQFITMTGRNQAQHQKICSDIREMHQMADMLLHPPEFKDKLYLYSDRAHGPTQEQQYNMLFKKYEKMHKQGYQLDDYDSQQIIQRAKNYYLRDRS